MRGTVTISSSYGSNGDSVGREVAERMGLRFYDRAIPVAVAHELAVDPEEAIAKDWRVPGRMERILSALGGSSLDFGTAGPVGVPADYEIFRQGTETILNQVADGEGGVILGRASMHVLANRTDVLCVRLDGPEEGRVAQAMRIAAIDEAEARRRLRETDAARAAYGQFFYGIDSRNPSLYHVILDSTALSVTACVEIILRAAEDRFGHPQV